MVIAGNSVEDVLNSKGGEDDAHHARGDIDAPFTHESYQARTQVQRDESHQENHGDRDAYGGQLLKVTPGLRGEQQNRGDCSGTRQQGHGEREDGNVVAVRSVFRFRRLQTATLAKQHRHRGDEEKYAATNRKSMNCHAKIGKHGSSGNQEEESSAKSDQNCANQYGPSPCGCFTLRQGHKQGHDSGRIYDDQQSGKSGQAEFDKVLIHLGSIVQQPRMLPTSPRWAKSVQVGDGNENDGQKGAGAYTDAKAYVSGC
jgi:hypothetical protein